MSRKRLQAYILLIIVAFIWGVAGPIIKFTLGGIPAFLFLTYRFGLSSLVAIILLVVLGKQSFPSKKILPMVLLYGLLSTTLSLGLLFLGLEKTTVLDMSLIAVVGPLLVALSGVYFLKEHITKKEKIGMSIAIIGSLIAVFEPIISNGLNFGQFAGNILVILYLLANTSSLILAKKLIRKGVSPLFMTSISFIVGFLTITPLAFVLYGKINPIQTIKELAFPYHLGVIFMALISGNLAYALRIKGQKAIEIGEAALFSYLHPIFAMPLAVLWLNEKATPIFVLGAVSIAIGVIIAEHKKPQRLVDGR